MKYIIANWKMKMLKEDLENWVLKFNGKFSEEENKRVIVAASFVHIPLLKNLLVEKAVQDISEFESGAHTGDVSAKQVKQFVNYTIVGHSERKEPRDLVYKKRQQAIDAGLTPIVCFTDFDQLEDAIFENTLVAWEDPDNIAVDGVFTPKDPKEIVEMYNRFSELFPNISVIYGGSVNRDNVGDLVGIKNLGGVLLGTASLDPDHFIDIYDSF